MTDLEQRFALEAFAFPTGEPGLILETDGTVWIIAADGTRTQVSGGGGGGLAGVGSVVVPGESVTVAPTEDGARFVLESFPESSISLAGAGGANAILLDDHDGRLVTGISLTVNEGYIVLSTGSGSAIAIAGDDGTVLLQDSAGSTIRLDAAGAMTFVAEALGFFGAGSTGQLPAPASVQDIADGLASLGFFAGAGSIPAGDPVEAPHIVGAGGEPAFENGWHNFTDFGSWEPCSFYKDRERVYLAGNVEGGTNQVFTLPDGYRPAHEVILAGIPTAQGQVVTPSGQVFIQSSINGLFMLDGLSFRVDPS